MVDFSLQKNEERIIFWLWGVLSSERVRFILGLSARRFVVSARAALLDRV
jgi:hypothetical protein